MQAVILAAGLGTRLRPVIGEDTPKVMTKMGNKPLLQYAVENLKKNAIEDMVIVVHHKKEQIMDYFGDGTRFGVKIQYAFQENPKGGTADAVRHAKGKIKEDKFLLVYGDNIFDVDTIDKILKEQSKHDGVIALKKMEDVSKFGVVEVKGNRVIRIVEKPESPASNLVLTGLFVLPSGVFDVIEKLKPSKRNELELTDAIQMLIDDGYDFGSVTVEGFWTDPRDAKELELAKQFISGNL